MHACPPASALLVIAALTSTVLSAATGEELARSSAQEFGRALTLSDTNQFKPLLPDRGKVRLRLFGFGPAEGSYSPDQVAALFNDFLREGKVRSFKIQRVECAGERFAFVKSTLKVANRDGHEATVELHLTFQPEGKRWVLREIREAPP